MSGGRPYEEAMSTEDHLDAAGKRAAYITNEWTDDPAIMQTQALCYVGLQLERIADALETQSSGSRD